jgi:hypothetical protein
MNFVIMDSNGNALDAFESYAAARDELRNLAFADRDGARDLALLTFDENGLAIGDAVVAADVAPEVLNKLQIVSAGWREISCFTYSAWTQPGDVDPLPRANGAATAPA